MPIFNPSGGGGGTPGGSDTELQYNDGGAFGGLTKFTWDDTDFLFGASATTKLQFRDTGLFINSSVDGQLDISADTLINLGVAGDTELGDGTLRVLKPQTTLKIDLGTSSLRYNDFYIGNDINIDSGGNIIASTTTGTKIGTATTQLLGFYNATPVDQPATISDPAGGGTVDAEARTAIDALIDRLQELGLIA